MRRIMKGVLFFGGLAVAAAAMAITFASSPTMDIPMTDMFRTSIIVAAGLIPASFALLMHARDVRETKENLSIFCRGFAIFWLVTGGLNLVGSTVLLIVFT